MYLIVANPESFIVFTTESTDGRPEDFKPLVEKDPPRQKDFYKILEVESIEGLDWDQIMNMMYSDDKETETLVLGMLENH